MTAGHFKTGNEAHIMFLLDSSALEPTSDRPRLDTTCNHGASRKACSATCSGGLWFVETDRRPCEQERHRESQLKGDLTTTAWSKKSRECPTLWGGKLGYNSSLPTYNKSLSIPAADPDGLQPIQAIAQEYIQHQQLGASFPAPIRRETLLGFRSSLLLSEQGKARGGASSSQTATPEAALELG